MMRKNKSYERLPHAPTTWYEVIKKAVLDNSSLCEQVFHSDDWTRKIVVKSVSQAMNFIIRLFYNKL